MLRLNRVRVQKIKYFKNCLSVFKTNYTILIKLYVAVKCCYRKNERKREGEREMKRKRKRKKKMIWNRLAVENERYRSLYDPNEFYYYCYNDGACRNLRTL